MSSQSRNGKSSYAVVPRALLSKAFLVMEFYAQVVDAHAIDIEDWDGYIYPWDIMREISMMASNHNEINAVDRYELLRTLAPTPFTELWLKNLETGVPFDKLVDDMVSEARKVLPNGL